MRIILISLLIFIVQSAFSQEYKRAMTIDDLVQWKRISEKAISDDGNYVVCTTSPWRGDAAVSLFNKKGEEIELFEPAESPRFSSSSEYMLVTLKPGISITDSLKLKKTKKENMPMDNLLIYNIKNTHKTLVDSLKSYKLSKVSDVVAYMRGNKNDSSLYVSSLNGLRLDTFPKVTEFGFAEDGNIMYYLSKGDTCGNKAGLFVYNPETGASRLVFENSNGIIKQTAFDKKGDKLAFLYCLDKDSALHNFSLYISENDNPARLIVQKTNPVFPDDWIISKHGEIKFSENSQRLFFGTAPYPKQKDSTIIDEYRPNVQVWSWDEPVQYTKQVVDKEKDLKRSYTAVYHFGNSEIVILNGPDCPNISINDDGNALFALIYNTRPYELEFVWRGNIRSDIYTVNVETGERKMLKKAVYDKIKLSPKGNYAYWYCESDSSWYSYSFAKEKEFKLSSPQTLSAWDEEFDMPDYPTSHGLAGWTTDDGYLLVYDKYDIWRLHPETVDNPVNITVNGRGGNISFRYVKLNDDEKNIDIKESVLLTGFNTDTKGSGFYRTAFDTPTPPTKLMAGDYMTRSPVKAKKSDKIIYTRETFEQYPELYFTDLSFKKPLQLTHGGEQQKGFKWGTAELVSWVSLDGISLEGLLYKPDNFDASKKYPLIVNFYERSSNSLHSYKMPEPHRSTVDYHLYTSNDYIIFCPDVIYTSGYPGECCYNCVMPGISMLMEKGFVDEKAIGAQGHSWGGYQVAYLATRTNLFAAIESGAPVVNMFSAYGGIRWGTGLPRSFQYEHGQSRIGASIWDEPLRYMENSPLLTMDKVETPILIMHNDNDGHVPWYQGIEYFIALKRLGKPAWLLNYTGEIHWPMKMSNQIDFQMRMFQFFEHYLRKASMPKWMNEGVPAVDADFELGY